MTKTIRAILCLALCGVMLLGTCACGETEEVPFTVPTNNPDTYDPEQSYHITKDEKSNTYSYRVEDYSGYPIHAESDLPALPDFEKINDQVLQISGRTNTYANFRWALFCNVRTGQKSQHFGGFLLTKGDNVAFIEERTGAYHVFVRNIFEEDAYYEATELPGLQVDKNGRLHQRAELNKDGDLEVTYYTKEGDKTVTVKMP